MLRKTMLAAILLLTAACSTPYQADGWTGGYKDQRLDPSTWRVTFLGNANRDAAFVVNFTNLVSYQAELTMHGLKTAGEGCPQGMILQCKVYVTEDALAEYGDRIG